MGARGLSWWTLARPGVLALAGLCLASAWLLGAGVPARADLTVVREVVVAPKKGSLAANLGPVNRSAKVRLTQAEVLIRPGPPPAAGLPLTVEVRARFVLLSEAKTPLRLTVGFPVSDSEFSSFEFVSFHVRGPGGQRTVFQRSTGYPRRMTHRPVSGPDADPALLLPDVNQAERLGDVYRSRREGRIMGGDAVGPSELGNLMVWAEEFRPGQAKTLEVSYLMEIPLQAARWSRRRVEGNHKGVWPQEANNVPLAFLKGLPAGEYYFFDYYLVTGAAWKGPIGSETVTLELDGSWSGHELFCNRMASLNKATRMQKSGKTPSTAYVYEFQEQEPKNNLYFALARP
jgi:hypothetical protein